MNIRMKVKKGDKVKISTGKDKGKTAKVLQVFPEKRKASVEGLNLSIKHIRPRREGEKGQRVEFPAPIDMSNLLLVCPKCGKTSRVGYKYEDKGKTDSKRKKIRYCKKCKANIDQI